LSELLESVKKWKEEIDKLNAETDKKLEEFLKMSKKSKVWRHKDE
jgi:hypothetical protein